MNITYVQFRDPISVGGKFHSISSWSTDKHASSISIAVEGGFVVLTCEDGKERAVPMTNVVHITREAKLVLPKGPPSAFVDAKDAKPAKSGAAS